MFIPALIAIAAVTTQPELRQLDRLDLPSDHSWLGTQVGGISGIDFEPGWNSWALVSDDKGNHGPVRGYLADVQINGERLTNVEVTLVLPMCWGTGELMKGPQYDAESIRFLPHRDYFGDPTLIWASEGAAQQGYPPKLYEMCTGATRMDSWTAPEWQRPDGRRRGAKNNRAYESLAVLAERVAMAATEEPLMQDGDTYVRLTVFDLSKPESDPVHEYAYPLDPPMEGEPGAQNGLVELVGLADGRLLSMERSWTMTAKQSVRIFLVEMDGATDVLGRDSLNSDEFESVKKTLLVDLGDSIGNAEGMCLGPKLDNGNQSLVLCTDNNFAPGIPTSFVLFEIVDPDGLVVPADRLAPGEALVGAH
ncbi:MAG: esterase-like activity of phytase family protein [Phycisphaerales bacterium]|nr:esterase-like activity of phytase family protein [Phycisphaerales bacterium]MCB9835096.1 esterase-like activity of phytase family protein [Phycisphaera sp.]